MSRRIHRADLALSSHGALIVNVAGFDASPHVDKLIARVLDEEGEMFIGVVVRKDEARALMKRLDDGVADAVAHTIGKRQRRRRVTARSKRKTAS